MSRVSSRIHRAAGILAAALAVGLAVFPATLRGQTSVPTKPAPAAPAKPAASAPAQSPAAAPAKPNPLRDVFFGETHIHTSWSFDAYVFGNTLTGPEDAYQFAMGKPIRHPAGYMVQIKRPLDFEAVTDHSEYMGTVRLANDPQSDLSKLPIAEKLKVRSKEDIQKVYLFLATSIITEPIKELVSPDVAGSVWKRVVEIADKYYQPGKFTTFAAYEWSSTPDNRNLHRNIIFKDTKKIPTLPFYLDRLESSGGPVELDGWPAQGRERAAGDLAQREPLRRRDVSAGSRQQGPADRRGVGAVAGEQRAAVRDPAAQGRVGNASGAVAQRRVRPARDPGISAGRRRSCAQAARQLHPRGVPERAGDAGDARLQPVQVRPRGRQRHARHRGGVYAIELFRRPWPCSTPRRKARLSGEKHAGMASDKFSTSGLGGVWAEENTREAIFAAMQRKETFGTSGVRIRVRFFGGWDFAPGVLQSKDWVRTGYANGVPMGGDLPAAKSKAPTFIVWAVKDPDDANLDRIQIVKGWTRNGQIFEKIYNVAWSGNRAVKGGARISDALVRRGEAELPPVRQHGGCQERDVYEHERRGGVEDSLDRPGLRSEPVRVLLCPGAADSDAALDDVRREKARCPAAGQRSGDGSGSCVDVSDLVFAERRSAQSGEAWDDGCRVEAKGRRRSR